MNKQTQFIPPPTDVELGRINEALQDALWREAHEARAALRGELARYSRGKCWEQVAFGAVVLLVCAATGLALGMAVALWQGDGIDGYRSEGLPVSCWHAREWNGVSK